MNKELPPAVPAIVLLATIAVLAGAGYRAVNGSTVKNSHEAAMTRANCIGKCHSEETIAPLIATKMGWKTHLQWKPGYSDSKDLHAHSTDPEVISILNNYFSAEAPRK